MDYIRRSFTFTTFLLLLIAVPAFGQDRGSLCDAGFVASEAHKSQLEEQSKPLQEEVARITTQIETIDKKYFKPKDKDAKGLEKLKNLRLPHLKSTLKLMKSLKMDLEKRKVELQHKLGPLRAKKAFVEKLGVLFMSIKAEKSAGKRLALAKQIELGIAKPMTEAEAKVKYLEARLQSLQIWAKQAKVNAEIKATQEELKAAKAELTFWSQYQTAAQKIQKLE